MKTSIILFAAAIATLSSSAFAQSSYGKTRAEVKAETVRALAAGEISSGGEAYQALQHPHIDSSARQAAPRAAAEQQAAPAALAAPLAQ